MALLVMILRKMIKNKWLEISLLLGLILSVALVSSMPIYTDAILQRMLVKDLENMQKSTNQYPGIHWSSIYFGDTPPEETTKLIQQTDDFMLKKASPGFDLPIKEYVRERATDRFKFVPVDSQRIDSSVSRIAEIGTLSDMEANIKLSDGRLPAKGPVDGVYEVLVVESALSNLKMVLGNVFQIEDDTAKTKIQVKPVGVFERKNDTDLFWYNSNLSSYNGTFFVNFDLFEQDFTSAKVLPIRASYWYFALDYANIDLSNVLNFIRTDNRIQTFLSSNFPNFGTKAPALATIGTYFDRENSLRKMLWSLNVPVMIMLAFYLFMVSNLITDRQKTEIAVLRSRGASRMQVLFGYVVEGLLLGAVAFVVGPFVGMMFTKVLGASNGFLEFVQRAALHVKVNREAFQYAFYAVLCSFLTTLFPAFLATRTTIVGHKQQMARQLRTSFWHRYFIDIILIAIAIYGLKTFERQRTDFLKLGLDASNFSVDPLLFLIPALFILGFGLIVLRIYPWFIRLFYWIGRKWWPPSVYSTLIQVGRSSTQYQFLMVFLIMTIATGLYSASAARTINKNTDDKILYKNGADMVMKIRWDNDAPPPEMGNGDDGGGGSVDDGDPVPVVIVKPKKTQYTEPPFQPIAQLPGVEHAAKVFVKNNANFTAGKEKGTVTLMGIETDEFGRTAWFRDQLLEHHFYDYLNLISTQPSAVLISKTLAEQSNVAVGDTINVGWTGVEPKNFVVYGIVDFWPSFNPNPTAGAVTTTTTAASGKSGGKKALAPMLIVGNLGTIQNSLALEPYDVWLKLKPGEVRQQLYNEITDKEIPVTELKDTREELQVAKNDPFQLAINGVMTLGFIISVSISFFGFLLYWVLSLYGRILQLGIFRAMGISFMQLIGMLITEQVLTSGAAIFIGIFTGNVTSRLFVQLFQISFNPATQVPPFQITFDPRDSLELYIIVTVMITLGLFILGYLLSRIKIHQAVKLGED